MKFNFLWKISIFQVFILQPPILYLKNGNKAKTYGLQVRFNSFILDFFSNYLLKNAFIFSTFLKNIFKKQNRVNNYNEIPVYTQILCTKNFISCNLPSPIADPFFSRGEVRTSIIFKSRKKIDSKVSPH